MNLTVQCRTFPNRSYATSKSDVETTTGCVTEKRKGRRKAEDKTRKETRKEGEHLDQKPHGGDKLKLT